MLEGEKSKHKSTKWENEESRQIPRDAIGEGRTDAPERPSHPIRSYLISHSILLDPTHLFYESQRQDAMHSRD